MAKTLIAPNTALYRFHRGLYLSLGLACAALAYAEWPFMPETAGLAVLCGISMIVAYRAEGRWSLSLSAANVVGGVIGLVMLAWIAFQFIRPGRTLLDQLPWPASLLPYLGPLVIVLIPAKLLRPKHLGDYWGLQFIGVMTIALACALAGDGILTGIVFAYFLLAVRCLTEFSDVRGSFGAGAAGAEPTPATPWRRTTLWVTGGALAAVLLAMATPRNSDAQWELSGPSRRLHIGMSEDRPAIDLNQDGSLQASSEVAFEVRATTGAGVPKVDLSPDQRWRGTTFNFYEQGKWSNRDWKPAGSRGELRNNPRTQRQFNEKLTLPGMAAVTLPDLGLRQFMLVFSAPPRANGPYYLAEPIWPPRQFGNNFVGPVVSESEGGGRHVWNAQPHGDLIPYPITRGPTSPGQYRQVTAPPSEPGISPPLTFDPAMVEHLRSLNGLRTLREQAGVIFDELPRVGPLAQLPTRTPGTLRVDPQWHEPLAKAVENWLRASGRFEYTQVLRRQSLSLDPVEDFLLNLKAGHCNRFSSTLALLLRCYGVPTRVVLGFQGAELKEPDGTYVIRQSHAHSWVEAVVTRPNPDGGVTWHWLMLDPTPSGERPEESAGSLGQWFSEIHRGTSEFFRNYVFEVTTERQERVKELLAKLSPTYWGPRIPDALIYIFGTPTGWIALLLSAGVIWWVDRVRRRLRPMGRSNAYRRLVQVADRAKVLRLDPAWTPKEWLHRLLGLVNDPELRAAAGRIVDRQYLYRYGGMSDDEAMAADRTDLADARQRLRRRR